MINIEYCYYSIAKSQQDNNNKTIITTMLVIKRKLNLRRRQGSGVRDVISNVIKSMSNKVSAQKVSDAVLNGGTKLAGESVAKGAKLAAESLLKRAVNKKKKTKISQKINSIDALINGGSGIIYE